MNSLGGNLLVNVIAGQTATLHFGNILAGACQTGTTVLFETNRSFIRPDQRQALEQAFAFGLTRPSSGVGAPVPASNRFLLIVGHTDQVGNASSNDQLSLQRAQAALAVFELNASIWQDLYRDEQWYATPGDRELEAMFGELEHRSPSTAEITELKSDATRRLNLIERYLMVLRPDWLPQQSPPIRPNFMTTPSPPVLGCGFRHPRVNAPNTAVEENRRVEFFLFNTATASVSNCSAYPSQQVICGQLIAVQVELRNECGNPFVSSFDLTLPTGGVLQNQQTDSQGVWTRANLPAGQYVLSVGGRSHTQMLSQNQSTFHVQIFRPITVNGSRLIRQGQTFRFFGTNAYYLMKESAFAGFGINPSAAMPTQISQFFAIAQSAGVKVVRIWGFNELQFDAAANTQLQPGTAGGHFQLNPGPGLNALGRIIDEAEQRGLYLIITLADYWHWEGGMRQYAKWADNTIGMPQTRNQVGNFHPDPLVEEIFYKGTKNGTPLPLDPRQLYRDYACHVIGRFNHKPNILAWELINEPRASEPSYLRDWIRDTAQHIRTHCNPSPKLLSIGGPLIDQLEFIFQDSIVRSSIDLVDTHLYPADLNFNATDARTRLGDAANLAHTTIGKPFYLGEFGLPSNVGRNRQQEYQDWFDIMDSNAGDGMMFWQLLPESRPAFDFVELRVQATQPLQSAVNTLSQGNPVPGDATAVINFVNNSLSRWPSC